MNTDDLVVLTPMGSDPGMRAKGAQPLFSHLPPPLSAFSSGYPTSISSSILSKGLCLLPQFTLFFMHWFFPTKFTNTRPWSLFFLLIKIILLAQRVSYPLSLLMPPCNINYKTCQYIHLSLIFMFFIPTAPPFLIKLPVDCIISQRRLITYTLFLI